MEKLPSPSPPVDVGDVVLIDREGRAVGYGRVERSWPAQEFAHLVQGEPNILKPAFEQWGTLAVLVISQRCRDHAEAVFAVLWDGFDFTDLTGQKLTIQRVAFALSRKGARRACLN